VNRAQRNEATKGHGFLAAPNAARPSGISGTIFTACELIFR